MTEALGTCPKCGRKTPEDAVICPGCDFILDTSFLGENITDALDEERPGAGGLTPEGEGVSSYGDPIILGALDDGELNSFEGALSGFTGHQSTQARIYVGGATQALMNPLAVPRMELGLAGEQSLKVTPFERHLLEYVDGRSNIGVIKSRCGLEETDFMTALALLADKGFIRMAGTSFEEDDGPSFDDHDDLFQEPMEESLDERTVLSMAPPPGTFDNLDGSRGDKDVEDDVFASSADGPPPSLVDQPADDSALDEPFAFADSIASVERDPEFNDAPDVSKTSLRLRRRRSSSRPPLPGGAEEVRGPEEAERFEGVSSDVFSSPPSLIENVHAIDTDLGRTAPPLPERDFEDSVGDSSVGDSGFEDSEDDGGFEEDGVEDDGFEYDDDDFEVATADILSMETQPPADDSTGEPAPSPGPVPMQAEDISLASLDGAPVEDDLLPLPGARDDWPSVPDPEPSPLPGASLEEAPVPSYLDVDDDDQLSIVDDGPQEIVPSSLESAPSVAPASAAAPATPTPAAPAADDAPVVINHDMRRKADKLFENALKDHGAGKLSSAIMNAKIAMIHNPGFTECRAALDAWEAQASGKTSTKTNREKALVDEAQRLEQRGDYQGAVRLLDQALEMSPNVAAIHNMKGVILATRLRRYGEASNCLYRAVELAPGNMTYKNNYSKVIVKEDAFGSREDGKPKKKRRFGSEKKDEKIVIKKLRPKVF